MAGNGLSCFVVSLEFKRFPWPRALLRFFQPEADAVHVVINSGERRTPMHRIGAGMWQVRLWGRAQRWYGRSYHFEIHRDGQITAVPDPRAYLTERGDDDIVSRFGDLRYRWKSDFTAPRFEEVVVYETHLPALTRHESAPVDDELRGTYVGARSPAVLDHLERLGVAVEFLPLHASDELFGQDWGYFSTSFHAPTVKYARDKTEANRELMALVDDMHGRGIPVMMDVVYNHGGELLARAWGEDRVYRREESGHFCHGSGCGPTIRTEDPLVRETIIESLEHLVRVYRVDGFRFDLGALHDVDTMLEIDRRLPEHIYLVAEPWALGGQKWGKGSLTRELIDTRWAVWNDDFREPGRAFITATSDHHDRDRLMTAITGSHEFDGGWASRPQQSVNYLSCHDGKTLADIVAGDRRRQFLGTLLILASQGIPMLYEGTELMYSKRGEHNTYDRPDLNQIDWTLATEHRELVDATARAIALRRRLPHFTYRRHVRRRGGAGEGWDIDFLYPIGYPHADNTSALGFLLRPPTEVDGASSGDDAGEDAAGRAVDRARDDNGIIVLLNGSTQGVEFSLPEGRWKTLIDGYALQVDLDGLETAPAIEHYYVHPGCGVVLAHRTG